MLLATLTAVLVAYRPTLSPPALHPRNIEYAQAKTELLVDTADSGLVDLRVSQLGLANAALEDVLLLNTDSVRVALGRAVGLNGREVSVSGPFTLQLNHSGFLSGSSPYSPPTDRRYRVLADVDGNGPVVRLYSQAPTTRAAITLVNAAASQLQQLTGGAYPTAARGGRTVLRLLGPAAGAVVVDGTARVEVMAFCFVFVLLVGGGLLYAVRRRRDRTEPRSQVSLGRLDEPLPADDWPRTGRLLPWSLAGFVAMIYLVPFDAIKLPFNLPLDTNLDRPILVVMILLWFASVAVVRGTARPRIKLTRVHVALLLFFAVSCLSVVLNGSLLLTTNDLTLSLKKLALLLSYIIFFGIASSVLRPREIPRFAAFMVGLGVVLAVATVVEDRLHYNVFYDLWGRILPITKPAEFDTIDVIGRLSVLGPTSEPLELAALLAMTLPFAVMGAITSPTKRRRLLYTSAAGLLLVGGLATSRKTSVVAPVVAVAVLIAYRPRPVLRSLLALGVPMVVVAHLIAPGAFSTVLAELRPGHVNNVTTTADRVARYDATRPDVMTHLLLGRGFQSYDPHKYRVLDNQYLDLVICTGLIGLVLYLAIFLVLLVVAHPTIRGPDPTRASLALAISAAVAVVAVANALFDVIAFPHLPYLLLFIAAMLVVLREPTGASRPDAVGASMDPGRPTGHPRPVPVPVLHR